MVSWRANSVEIINKSYSSLFAKLYKNIIDVKCNFSISFMQFFIIINKFVDQCNVYYDDENEP
jgi:hypothetical protein